MENKEKKTNQKRKKTNDVEFYVMDIRYTDTYNPEKIKLSNKEYRYIIDGEGKEKLCVKEIHEIKEDE